MRRRAGAIVVATLASALVAGPGAAATSKPRVQTLEYAGGGVTTGPGQEIVVRGGEVIGGVAFRGGPERFVSVEIEDAHGLPVAAVVAQPEEDGADETRTPICGASEKPLRIRPYEELRVYLLNGVCADGAASIATTGTVTATFTRRR